MGLIGKNAAQQIKYYRDVDHRFNKHLFKNRGYEKTG